MQPEFPSAEDYASERARFDKFEIVDIGAVQQGVVAGYKNQVVLDANGECLRLSVFEGEYRWHFHPDTDELFLVMAGELHIEFKDRAECVLHDWQCLCVPAGAVHRTRAVVRTVNLTFEKQGAKTLFVDPHGRTRLNDSPRRNDGRLQRPVGRHISPCVTESDTPGGDP